MKLKHLKVANAVPCGPETKTFFDSNDFDIEAFDQFKIKITHKRTKGDACTSFFNAVYWKEMSENAAVESEAGAEPARRGRAPKAQAQA